MRKFTDRIRRVSLLTLPLLALPGCGRMPGRENVVPRDTVVLEGDNLVKGTGTIRWFEVEGGFYAIRGDDGTTYDPISLPAEFRQDGLRIYFEARVRNDLVGTHMVGPLIEITSIRPM